VSGFDANVRQKKRIASALKASAQQRRETCEWDESPGCMGSDASLKRVRHLAGESEQPAASGRLQATALLADLIASANTVLAEIARDRSSE
jgi:hypothetical protein